MAPATAIRRAVRKVGATDDSAGTLIQEVCRHLVSRVKPPPEAIVLTGSFARGEGSVLRMGERLQVLGDMEFMVVFRLGADRVQLQRELDLEAKGLSQQLAAQGVECEVEFRAITQLHFDAMRPHIFGYELLTRGRTVWGNSGILTGTPKFSAAEIPHWDAWRMLNNRILEQLQWIDATESGNRADLLRIAYQLVKFQLDIGTTLLVFAGRYENSYAARAAALLQWASEANRDTAPEVLEKIAECVRECTAFKLAPSLAARPLGIRLDHEDTETLRRDLRWAILEFLPMARSVWRWEAAKFTRQSASLRTSNSHLQDAVLVSQSVRERLRGWAKLALTPVVRRQPGFAGRMLRLLRRGSPRYLIYRVASELYFQLAEVAAGVLPDGEPAALEPFLPALFAEHEQERRTWWRLRANVLTGWRLFLRNHWA